MTFFLGSQIKMNPRTFAEKIHILGFWLACQRESEKDPGILSWILQAEDTGTFYFFSLNFDFVLLSENGNQMSANLCLVSSVTREEWGCRGHLFFTVRKSSLSFQLCRESPTSHKWSLEFLNVLCEGRWGRQWVGTFLFLQVQLCWKD